MGAGRTVPLPPPPPGAWARQPPGRPHRGDLGFLLAASLREAPPLLPGSPPALPLLPGRTPPRSTPVARGAALQSAFAVPLPFSLATHPSRPPRIPWLGAAAREEGWGRHGGGCCRHPPAGAAGVPGWGGTVPGEASTMVRPLSRCPRAPPAAAASCPSVLLLLLLRLLLLLHLQIGSR